MSTAEAPMTTTFAQRRMLLAGDAVEVLHPLRQALLVHEDAPDDGVRSNLELAGLQRRGQQMIRRAEERSGVAAGAAVAAVVAGGKAVQRQRAIGAAAVHDRDVRATSKAVFSSRSPHRSAGGGIRNLLPGSASESSSPPQTPISCSTLS